MPAAIRKDTDLSTGHSTFPPRLPKQGSTDVIINNKNAVRVDDRWVDHHTPPLDDEFVASNSSTVIINNKKAVRNGDIINCGDKADHGSSNVNFG